MEKHLILLLYIIQKRYQIKNAGKELSFLSLHLKGISVAHTVTCNPTGKKGVNMI